MANEPKVPDIRDDDPEDVSDKLAIAAAMWGRGDRGDAITWIRRAAEAASDAEQDMRALELAKAASELAALGESSQSAVPAATPAPEPPASRPGSASPPGPPPKPSKAPPAKAPSVVPTAPAPGRAPASAAAMPKKPPGSKLPPLPPLRPLGSAPASPPKAPRLPSMITSATGAASASGMVSRDETPAPPEPKLMPWDDAAAAIDDEPTKQIDLGSAPPAQDLEETREIAAIAMQPVRVEKPEPPPAPAPAPAAELPIAVGVRVRVVVAADGVHIVPEGETTEGVAAVIVPLNANDDLRSLFQRRA